MNSAPTQGLELYKKEHLRFQRISQMLHKINTREERSHPIQKNFVIKTRYFNNIVCADFKMPYCSNNNIEVDGEVKGKQRPGWMGNLKRTPPFS